jgi:hypothetical protein
MTNHFARDSQRSRPRNGSFERGHAKRGGRKRGTPNAFSKEDKSAIIEAADRVGYDLNGKDGIFGYLRWLAECHTKVFVKIFLIRILKAAPGALVPKSESATELNQAARAFLGMPIRDGTYPQKDGVQSEPGSPWAWTGQPVPVGPLMDAAVRSPKDFSKLLRDAFFPPRSKRRRAPTRPIFG